MSEGMNSFSAPVCNHKAVHASYPACAGAQIICNICTFLIFIHKTLYTCIYVHVHILV